MKNLYKEHWIFAQGNSFTDLNIEIIKCDIGNEIDEKSVKNNPSKILQTNDLHTKEEIKPSKTKTTELDGIAVAENTNFVNKTTYNSCKNKLIKYILV